MNQENTIKKLTVNGLLEQKLRRLKSQPNELFYLGANVNDLLTAPAVAIIGTRKPTLQGRELTIQLAETLAKQGVIIISGNALGVDVLAQNAALKAGGKVISVLPSGLQKIYPATNRVYAEAVVDKGGCLLSEYDPKHVPTRYDFLHRNRLIAALSDVVVIPEAAQKSGSLNTAKHAFDMNIPTLCYPGNVSAPMSEGTNELIKLGKAKLTTKPADVLELLGDKVKHEDNNIVIGDTPEQTRIIELLIDGISDIADLQQRSQFSTSELNITLSMLEVDGRIIISSSGDVTLTKK